MNNVINSQSTFHLIAWRPGSVAVVALAALTWGGLAYGGEIHRAAEKGDVARVKVLLQENPALISSRDDSKTYFGYMPLHMAAVRNHKEVVELLLANHADVNAKNNTGWTALHIAAFGAHNDIAELLLANGAYVNAKDNLGRTPLQVSSWAARNHHAELVKLLQQYSDRDIQIVVKEGALTKVKALLTEHPDLVFNKDEQGATPLHWAANKDVAELLLANKADLDAKAAAGGTPLHWAAFAGNKEVVEVLLANKAAVDAKDNSGATPLYNAALQGHKEVAQLLLANHADVNAKNNNGDTALQIATFVGYKDVAELLRQQGGPDASGGGQTSISNEPRIQESIPPATLRSSNKFYIRTIDGKGLSGDFGKGAGAFGRGATIRPGSHTISIAFEAILVGGASVPTVSFIAVSGHAYAAAGVQTGQDKWYPIVVDVTDNAHPQTVGTGIEQQQFRQIIMSM